MPSPMMMRWLTTRSGVSISAARRSAAGGSASAGASPGSSRMSRPSPKERMLRSMIACTRPSLSPKAAYRVDSEPPLRATMSVSRVLR